VRHRAQAGRPRRGAVVSQRGQEALAPRLHTWPETICQMLSKRGPGSPRSNGVLRNANREDASPGGQAPLPEAQELDWDTSASGHGHGR